MENEKRCSLCHLMKFIDEFYNEKRGCNGKSVKCKVCHKVLNKKWKKQNPEKVREGYRRYGRNHAERRCQEARTRDAKNPLRAKARRKVRYEIEMGRMVRPERCEDCSKRRRVVGHHDDYSKPLDVRWLCYPCHELFHSAHDKKGE